MPSESRVKRWRDHKRQQGLKHVSVWLTTEEEFRLKDLALQWHCSPSQVVQRALAQMSTSALDYGTPTDTLRIRKLILAELAALGIPLPGVTEIVTGGASGGPTDTLPQSSVTETPPDHEYEADPGHSLATEPVPTAQPHHTRKLTPRQIRALRDKHLRGVPVPALMEEYGISRASVFRYLQSDKR